MEYLEDDVVGVDEVNYSPSIAGDCVVAACRLPPAAMKVPVRDSKQTTPAVRRKLFAMLRNAGAQFVVVPVTLPMMEARGLCMSRGIAMLYAVSLMASIYDGLPNEAVCDGPAFAHLGIDNDAVRLRLARADTPFDGKTCSGIALRAEESADRKYKAVAAASIVAKVYVDALFEGYGRMWPEYGMERDHGSLSKRHRLALKRNGPSAAHRFRGYGEDWWRDILGYVPSKCSVR